MDSKDFINSIKEPSKKTIQNCDIKREEKECKSIIKWLEFELKEIKKKNQ